MALPANGGRGYVSFAALVEELDLADGEHLPRLPPPPRRAASPSLSLHDAAGAWEALPVPAPSKKPPSPTASSTSMPAVGSGASDLEANRMTSNGIAVEFINLSKGLATIGGGLVKVFTAVGLIDEGGKGTENKAGNKTQNKSESKADNKADSKEEEKADSEEQEEKEEDKKKEEDALHRFYGVLSYMPGCVTKTARMIEGLSDILTGFKASTAVISPAFAALRSVISAKRTRRALHYSSEISVLPKPLGTGHTGLRVLLSRQTLTRSQVDRAILVDDVYGLRMLAMPRTLPGTRIINNMTELCAAIVQFKEEDSIHRIDVERGKISLDEAMVLYSRLQTESATGLLKDDSVLGSLVLQARFVMENKSNVESYLEIANSVVSGLRETRAHLAARLDGVGNQP